ncbi:hypothetical protein NUU61_008422 [Penicillium alfredii]|uniref:Uncharacterized protein n=1 Tax=Penicillium alfredii TaxID=1506179 RepID=A0A9W9ESI7_9EURO|nr:uncharacterized protein NUU61_008422 [Penicillium alfredii]KAJ5087115.1 hypothetical protein NUU61_008422 [Penicillium alfredii]
MPRVSGSSSAGFQIDLAAPPGWTYAAGDTIIGTLARRLPIVTPDASVTLVLIGQVRSKITASRNQNHPSHYLAQWTLWPPKRMTIYNGPLHIPESSDQDHLLSWPFSVTIPEGPVRSALGGHSQGASFLPLDESEIAQHSLPGTFFSSGISFSTSSEGIVEYYLEAELRYNRGPSLEIRKAVASIKMRQPGVGTAIVSHDLKHHATEVKVQSQRLFPEMENAELTVKQKAQKIVGLSKVPEFWFNVDLVHPTIVQIGDASPIPVYLRIIPQKEKTSVSIRDATQRIQVNWVKMRIQADTILLASGNFTTRVHQDSHTACYDLGLEDAFPRLERPVMISCNKDTGEGSVDIGNVLQLVLHENGLSTGNWPLRKVSTIYPDFITYSIRHRHWAEWEVSLTVAGETMKVRMRTSLRVVAAS